MFKKILLGLLVVIVIFLIVVAVQPAEYSVTRSLAMAAPPDAPFAQVNDFKKWEAWSPWEKMDKEMKKTISEPSGGTGATYEWKGNGEVGQGSMKISESKPNELIKIDLHFMEPMEGVCPTEFTFKPEGDKTKVTWTMNGKKNFMAKAFCMFMNMDKMVGGDFEKGLASMKEIVEKKPN